MAGRWLHHSQSCSTANRALYCTTDANALLLVLPTCTSTIAPLPRCRHAAAVHGRPAAPGLHGPTRCGNILAVLGWVSLPLLRSSCAILLQQNEVALWTVAGVPACRPLCSTPTLVLPLVSPRRRPPALHAARLPAARRHATAAAPAGIHGPRQPAAAAHAARDAAAARCDAAERSGRVSAHFGNS